jgi:hypothetical protein
MQSAGWVFVCGCAGLHDLVFVAREREDLMAQDVVASTFCMWNRRTADPGRAWGMCREIVEWRPQGMATIKPPGGLRVVVALGSGGQYHELEPANASEHVGRFVVRAPTRVVEAVGDQVFAAGMGRSVLVRRDRGVWDEFGPGTTADEQGRVIGFEGLDGRSGDDLYAVGWAGEIWRWHEARWRRVDSPTNQNLNAVVCTAEGTVYAVGDGGVMVRGEQERWDVVETGRHENLMDVASLGGEVFVVTDYRILVLRPDGLVNEDRFVDGDRPATCLQLLRAPDGLLSLGPKDLFGFVGGVWQRIV